MNTNNEFLWGIGKDSEGNDYTGTEADKKAYISGKWPGQNVQGKALMCARARIIADQELHPPIVASNPQAMEQDSDLFDVDQVRHHRQLISSRGWFAVFIDTHCEAQIASIS